MPLLHEFEGFYKNFTAHPLLFGGHLQTISGKSPGKAPAPPSNTAALRVPLPDGDVVSFMIDPPDTKTSKGIVALFHGLGGNAGSAYNLRIGAKMRARGFSVARFNHRGCGSFNPNEARGIYHCGSGLDMLEGLIALTKKFPGLPLYIVGFSLSGNVLLNGLGGHPDVARILQPQLRAALSICPPLHLEKSSLRLSRYSNMIYDQYYSRMLVKYVKDREKQFPEQKKTHFSRWLTLRDFDQSYTAPFGGFKDRDDYYTQCSPYKKLDRIELPTVVLGAVDDPVVDDGEFRISSSNKNIEIHLSKSGGHMGFISARKTEFGDRRWMDGFALEWLRVASK